MIAAAAGVGVASAGAKYIVMNLGMVMKYVVFVFVAEFFVKSPIRRVECALIAPLYYFAHK